MMFLRQAHWRQCAALWLADCLTRRLTRPGFCCSCCCWRGPVFIQICGQTPRRIGAGIEFRTCLTVNFAACQSRLVAGQKTAVFTTIEVKIGP